MMLKLADLIEKHRDQLAEVESMDNGKPKHVADAVDIGFVIECFRYYAGWTDKVPLSCLFIFLYLFLVLVSLSGRSLVYLHSQLSFPHLPPFLSPLFCSPLASSLLSSLLLCSPLASSLLSSALAWLTLTPL